MRIAITGTKGHLARHYIERIPKDVEVVPLDRSNGYDLTKKEHPKIPQVDYCIHFAAATPNPTTKQDYYFVNNLGTYKLLHNIDMTNRKIKRFIYISTGGVYGYGNEPFTEKDKQYGQHEDMANPPILDEYAWSKSHAEDHAKFYSKYFPITIIRPFFPYGPDFSGNRLVSRLYQKIVNGEPIQLNVDGRPRINPIHVDDLCKLIEKIRKFDDQEPFQVFNACGPQTVDIRQLAEMLGRKAGKQPIYEYMNKESKDMVGDDSKTFEYFKFRGRSVADGIKFMKN